MLRVATRVLHKVGHMASLQLMQDTLDLALKHCDKSRRSRVRFPMVTLEFFIGIVLPAVLRPSGWWSLWQKWVPGYILGGKGDRWVGLTTFSPSYAVCRKIWESRPSGTFWACNRPVQGLLYIYRHWLFISVRCLVTCLISNGSHTKIFSIIFIPVPDDGFSKSQNM